MVSCLRWRIWWRTASMAEKLVLVGVLPEVVLVEPGDQVVWLAESGNLRVEFDPQRCPFSSNVLQAPPGVRLMSGTPRAGFAPGSYKYRLSLNEHVIAHGEVIIRAK
ncbi:MAG TPA: hypothetical protein VGT03_00205 [Candidatus Acidoferrales bacterium]|nr:hypothetical protein [Candidatus Acidoferrales bacterium]